MKKEDIIKNFLANNCRIKIIDRNEHDCIISINDGELIYKTNFFDGYPIKEEPIIFLKGETDCESRLLLNIAHFLENGKVYPEIIKIPVYEEKIIDSVQIKTTTESGRFSTPDGYLYYNNILNQKLPDWEVSKEIVAHENEFLKVNIIKKRNKYFCIYESTEIGIGSRDDSYNYNYTESFALIEKIDFNIETKTEISRIGLQEIIKRIEEISIKRINKNLKLYLLES